MGRITMKTMFCFKKIGLDGVLIMRGITSNETWDLL